MVITEELKQFPTTRYQGSKRKILSWLYGYFAELEFDTALDAFGGTGAVSYLLKKMGKQVTFNDELTFNSIIGKAIIENSNIKLSEYDIELITNVDLVEYSDEFIAKNFSDIYFTDDENIWIDKFLQNLEKIDNGNIIEFEYKKALSMFSLFQASMTKRPYNLFHRKNLYMRLNDVDRTFGNKITWEKSFKEQVEKFAKEANESIFDNKRKCRVFNESVFNLENEPYDLVYLDPPYVDINCDHDTVDYLFCYHFLEGLTKYHEWKDYIDFETKNLRFKREFYSTNFKKRNIEESFEILFEKFQKSIIVISYKKNGVPSIETIENKLKKFKKNIKTFSKHYIYALNKQNGDKKNNREVLIVGY